MDSNELTRTHLSEQPAGAKVSDIVLVSSGRLASMLRMTRGLGAFVTCAGGGNGAGMLPDWSVTWSVAALVDAGMAAGSWCEWQPLRKMKVRSNTTTTSIAPRPYPLLKKSLNPFMALSICELLQGCCGAGPRPGSGSVKVKRML